jgi:SAM-dependent methyltransferase
MHQPGLDYAFLKHIGATADGEAALHGIYVPFFYGRNRVLDLGCGMGGFIKLLRAQGIDAYGVDSDPQCVADAHSQQLPVVEADVVEHLRLLEPASLDGIFSAHMVEHMPYHVTLEVVQLAHRALKPGGRLLLVTPNPRALITHLEMYYMHFGHVALYHPNLLHFFLTYVGFSQVAIGENPHTIPQQISPHMLLGKLPVPGEMQPALRQLPLAFHQILPKPKHWLRRWAWTIKMGLVRWLVRPYVDQLIQETTTLNAEVLRLNNTLRDTLEVVNRSFECHVLGEKG